MPAKEILVSVVIPVKNGAATIERCLDTLLSQTIAGEMEIILIDSGSTDGTLEKIKNYPVKLLDTGASTFNHGLTRNLGLAAASGAFIYFTVQDSWQKEPGNLQKMLTHFDDPLVAGVCGNQGTPSLPGYNPVHWYKPLHAPATQRLYFPLQAGFDALTPKQQAEACAWDNVNAMYRKTVLEQYPFIKTDYGEDMAWAKTALQHGFVLERGSAAVVYHYHYRDFDYAFKITLTYHYHLYKFFEVLPSYPPIMGNTARAAYRLVKNHSVKWRQKLYWFFHNLGGEWGAWYATYIFRRAARNNNPEKITSVYNRYCKAPTQGRQGEKAEF